MSYRVNAEWDTTGWWVVTVPDVPGAITQCRRLDQVPADAAEVIEIQTGDEVKPEDLDVRSTLPGKAGDVAATALLLRREAQALKDRADDSTKVAVKLLREEGFPLRDIGALTGITFQRAQQLAKAGTMLDPEVQARLSEAVAVGAKRTSAMLEVLAKALEATSDRRKDLIRRAMAGSHDG